MENFLQTSTLTPIFLKSRRLRGDGLWLAEVIEREVVGVEYLDTVKNSREIKYPFSYNFEDPLAEKDWQNMFVTHLMATKKGNCHSLPYLYKILADEFGVEANLALASNHIYITHLCHDPKITWYNTELISGRHPIDAWIQLVTYISMDAIRNGLYGLPLDDKQSVALCLVDLANGYTRKFPQNDNKFALQCLDLALAQFPVLLKLNSSLIFH